MTGCKGYELIKDLDFNDPDSYRSGSRAARSGLPVRVGQPIGSSAYPFTAIFEGNGLYYF